MNLVEMTKKVAIAIVVSAVLAPLALSGCMALLFSGGVGNIIRNARPAPDPHGPRITRARMKATEEIEAALTAIDSQAGFTSYATSTDDRCYKGENNWKIKDGYAHRCTVRMTRFYGLNGDFRAHVLGLEDSLASSGWQMPRSTSADLPPTTFREMFERYYDVYCSGTRIAVFGSGPVTQPRCEVSRLPRSSSDGYRKADLVLWIECAEREDGHHFMMDLTQRVPVGALFKEHDRKFNLYSKTDLQDVEALVQRITSSHRYVVSVTVQRTYFEN
jgi:hypothetical protein